DLHAGAGEAPVSQARAVRRNRTVQEAVGLVIGEIMRAYNHSLRPVLPVAKPDFLSAAAVGGVSEMHAVRTPTRRHFVPIRANHRDRGLAIQGNLDHVVPKLAG